MHPYSLNHTTTASLLYITFASSIHPTPAPLVHTTPTSLVEPIYDVAVYFTPTTSDHDLSIEEVLCYVSGKVIIQPGLKCKLTMLFIFYFM